MLRPLVWPEAQRVVSRPGAAIAALATVVDDRSELDALLMIEGLTNPLAREAAGALATIPPARRYVGPLASLVMTPFVLPRASRFSDGVYGVLYAGDVIETALREAGHHAGLRLAAAAAPAGTTQPLFSFSFHVDTALVDIRGGEVSLYDPDQYDASRAFGRAVREAGHNGIHYDSVRHSGGTCVALFWPDAVMSAKPGDEWRCYFDGERITEYARVV